MWRALADHAHTGLVGIADSSAGEILAGDDIKYCTTVMILLYMDAEISSGIQVVDCLADGTRTRHIGGLVKL